MVRSVEPPPSPALIPCLAELFSTTIRPPLLRLRIDKILSAPRNAPDESSVEPTLGDSQSPSHRERRIYRLLLSDGALLVQARLEPGAPISASLEEGQEGDILLVHKYRVLRVSRVNGRGDVVFLGLVEGEIEIPVREPMLKEEVETVQKRALDQVNQKVEVKGASEYKEPRQLVKRVRISSPPPRPRAAQATTALPLNASSPNSSSDSDSDGFETGRFDGRKASERREALQELRANRNSTHPTPLHNPPPNQPQQHPDPAPTTTPNPTPFPTSPPNHTLHSLLFPPSPLPKSYPCTLLAITTWISPSLIYPRSAISPFPPKRHIKIHDLSIRDRHAGVTVAVYCDAARFLPRLGTVAVLRGVVVQSVGGGGPRTSGGNGKGGGAMGGEVVVNAYKRLSGEVGVGGVVGRWWEDERGVLEGMGLGEEVEKLREWWEEREKKRKGVAK